MCVIFGGGGGGGCLFVPLCCPWYLVGVRGRDWMARAYSILLPAPTSSVSVLKRPMLF